MPKEIVFTHDIVGIIPARAGSKRVPRKNMRLLAGKPLVQWTIEAAQKSGCLDLLVVSSDDNEVLDLAREFGCIAVLRPDSLSGDTATTFDAMKHSLDVLNENGMRPQRVMLLQPTSPLRSIEDIQTAVQKMHEKKANSIISVCPVEHSPLWCNTLDAEGRMDNFISEAARGKRSQDLPVYYRLNGAVYLAFTDAFIEHAGFVMPNTYAIVMPQERSVDIDTEFDLKLVGCIHSNLNF